MSAVLETTESAILSGAIDPLELALTPELARRVLDLALTEADQQDANELLKLAKAASLADDQAAALDNYRRAGRILELLKSKARLALQEAG